MNAFLEQRPKRIGKLEFLMLCVVVTLSLWPSYLAIDMGDLPQIDPARVLMFFLSLYWFNTLLVNESVRRYLLQYLYTMPKILGVLFFLFSWKMLSVIVAARVDHAFYWSLKDIFYNLIFFFVGLTVWKTSNQIIRTLKVFLWLGALVSLIGLVELNLGSNLFFNFVENNTSGLSAGLEHVERGGHHRVAAVFSNSLSASNFGVLIFPIAVFFSSCGSVKQRAFSVCILLLVVILIWSTGSRTGLVVSLGIVMGQVYLYANTYLSKIKNSGFLKVTVIVFCITIIGLVTPKIFSLSEENDYRLLQLEKGIPFIIASPILGYGPGEAAMVAGIVYDDHKNKTIDNYFLSIALESGIPGLVAFVVLHIYFIRLAWRLRKQLPKYYSRLTTALFFALLGNFIFMTTVSLKEIFPFVFLLFSMLLAIKNMLIYDTDKS